MIIRFGYVSHAISLWEASPAKTVTFTRYQQLDPAERLEKLQTATRSNLINTLRMLHYNIAHEIDVYRFSSSLAPLATHPEVLWDYVTPFQDLWQEIGGLVKNKGLRVSFHPSQFTLFTSNNPTITANAVVDMEYHYRMLEAMGLEDRSVINIHIGGAYGNKEETLLRFHKNLKTLPSHIKAVMTLENDDKTYDSAETLMACKQESIPFVFDYHHHLANPVEMELEEILHEAFRTWEVIGMKPKIHLSSPKSESAFRSHADFVDPEFSTPLIKALRSVNQDIDVMIEAKAKDQATLKLVEALSKQRGVKRIAGAALEWK